MVAVVKGEKPCKDCEKVRGGCKCLTAHPGPRCHTCARRWKAAQKAATREKTAVGAYDLDSGDLGRLRGSQGGFCAILGCRAQGKTRDLVIDHDHVTNEVRGLLCNVHNEMLGRAGDDPAVFISLALYLLDPPARRVLVMRQRVDSGDIHSEEVLLGYYSEFVRFWLDDFERSLKHAKEIRNGSVSI